MDINFYRIWDKNFNLLMKHVGGITFSLQCVNWGDPSHFTSLFSYQGIDRVNINLVLLSFPNFWSKAGKKNMCHFVFSLHTGHDVNHLTAHLLVTTGQKHPLLETSINQSNCNRIMQYILRNRGIARIILLLFYQE